MLLIQNKAILDFFEIKRQRGDRYRYEFKNKETNLTLIADSIACGYLGFQNLLASDYFPSSVLIVTRFLSSNNYRDFQRIIKENFNYKGLKFSSQWNEVFKFQDKPNIVFGDIFYSYKSSAFEGVFNRRFFDLLVTKVLPLLKDEEDSLNTFFNLFSPDCALRGKFNCVGSYLSAQDMSIFSNASYFDVDFSLEQLQGKILVGNNGIEVLDPDFIKNSEILRRALTLDKYTSQVPQELTGGEVLRYPDYMSNFSNWFYVQNNMVNV